MEAKTKDEIDEDNGYYYWAFVECNNCGNKEQLAFMKEYQIHEYKCPTCECKTLSKKNLSYE